MGGLDLNPVPSSKDSPSPRDIFQVSNFDSKFKTYNRVDEPLEVVRCKKSEKVIAEPKEPILPQVQLDFHSSKKD
jgi:hypothetical protein